MEETLYGVASWDPATDPRPNAQVHATGPMLWDWAHRQGAAWPCSHLTRLDDITATFNADGLVDIECAGLDLSGWEDADVPADEFNAWSSDVFELAGLPKEHPCYYVIVGQFQEG